MASGLPCSREIIVVPIIFNPDPVAIAGDALIDEDPAVLNTSSDTL
jgi:hypothetical protein